MNRMTMRPYHSEKDFWRMRAFLREVLHENQGLERSWSVPRLDYWRWHFIASCGAKPIEEGTFLWETSDGRIAAALHQIFSGEAFIHIHPSYKNKAFEEEIFRCAEDHLAYSAEDGTKQLVTLVDESDELRRNVVESRGFSLQPRVINRWWRDLDKPLPEVEPIPGYHIRSMGDASEYDARALTSWRAFHPDEPDEGYESGDWYANMQYAPLYRRELDIVAEAPDGEIASFFTIWYDDTTRSAVCVVVGTAPAHRRQGLGKAVAAEALRRLQKMGGVRVFANGMDMPANALYKSVLGNGYKVEAWKKTFR